MAPTSSNVCMAAYQSHGCVMAAEIVPVERMSSIAKVS